MGGEGETRTDGQTDDRRTHTGEEGAALREAAARLLAVHWGRGSRFDGWSRVSACQVRGQLGRPLVPPNSPPPCHRRLRPEWNLTVPPGAQKAKLRAGSPHSSAPCGARVPLWANARPSRLRVWALPFSLSSTLSCHGDSGKGNEGRARAGSRGEASTAVSKQCWRGRRAPSPARC